MKKTLCYIFLFLLCFGSQYCTITIIDDFKHDSYTTSIYHFSITHATLEVSALKFGLWDTFYRTFFDDFPLLPIDYTRSSSTWNWLNNSYKTCTADLNAYVASSCFLYTRYSYKSPPNANDSISNIIKTTPGIVIFRYRLTVDNNLYARGYIYTRPGDAYQYFIPDDELYDESLPSTFWNIKWGSNATIPPNLNLNRELDALYYNDTYQAEPTIFSYEFHSADFPYPPARVPRYFRLWNTASASVRIETYKEDTSVVYNLYAENGTDRAWIFRGILEEHTPTPTILDKVDGVLWQTSASWQTVLSSGSVGTVFESNAEYGGPYLMKIYNNDTNELLFIDKIRHPYLSEEELSPYLNMSWESAFGSGLAIKPQLNWKRKDKITTNAISIKAAESGYAHEFYASYPK